VNVVFILQDRQCRYSVTTKKTAFEGDVFLLW